VFNIYVSLQEGIFFWFYHQVCWLGPHFSDEARQQPLCHTNVQQHIILAQGPVVQFPENGQLHHWTHEKKNGLDLDLCLSFLV
jgi:hypothetical protein